MESSLYLSIVALGFFLIVINEFILWKIWPRIFCTNISVRRRATVATLITDPLIASIVCPLASDLYFSLNWLSTCGFYFLFIVFAVMLILYGSSLVMSFKVVSSLIPVSESFHNENSSHHRSMLVSFGTSLLVNSIFTWIMLSLTTLGDEEFNPAEECFSFMVYDKIFIICAVSFGFQILFTVFYAHLSCTVHRHLSSVHHEATDYVVPDKKTASKSFSFIVPRDEYFRNDLLTYGAISFICLLITHGLRSTFSVCSCLPFLQMSTGIYWTNWLILGKLPGMVLLYWAISKFI